MKTNIKVTNIELTPEIEEYITKKVDNLDKYINNSDPAIQAFVEVGKTTNHHQAGYIYSAEIQITIPHEKSGVRAVSEQEGLYSAIDDAQEEIKKELTKIKDRRITNSRKGGRLIKKLISFFNE